MYIFLGGNIVVLINFHRQMAVNFQTEYEFTSKKTGVHYFQAQTKQTRNNRIEKRELFMKVFITELLWYFWRSGNPNLFDII